MKESNTFSVAPSIINENPIYVLYHLKTYLIKTDYSDPSMNASSLAYFITTMKYVCKNVYNNGTKMFDYHNQQNGQKDLWLIL